MISCPCSIGSAYCSAPSVNTTSWRRWLSRDIVGVSWRWLWRSGLTAGIRLLDAGVRVFRRVAEDFSDSQAELLVDHDDLAARDRRAVDEQVHGLARHPVQRHDRALSQLERLADGHPRAPHLDRQVDRDVAQAPQVVELVRRRLGGGDSGGSVELLQLELVAHLPLLPTARRRR